MARLNKIKKPKTPYGAFLRALKMKYPTLTHREITYHASDAYKHAKKLYGGGIIDDFVEFVNRFNPLAQILKHIQTRKIGYR